MYGLTSWCWDVLLKLGAGGGAGFVLRFVSLRFIDFNQWFVNYEAYDIVLSGATLTCSLTWHKKCTEFYLKQT